MGKFKGFINAFNSIDAGLIILDTDKRIVFLNDWVIQRSPFDEATIDKCFDEILPQLKESRVNEAIEQALSTGYPSIISNIFNRTPFPLYPLAQSKQGTLNKIQQTVCISLFSSDETHDVYCLIQINDVSPAVMRERALEKQVSERRQAELQLDQERRLFMAGPSIVFKWKAIEGLPVEYISPNVESQLGYNPEKFVNAAISFLEVVHPEDLKRVINEIRTNNSQGVNHFEQEYRLRNSVGAYQWFHVVMMVIRNELGDVSHYHGYMQDVTLRKKAESEIARLAYYDVLTELPNRRFFIERLEKELSRCAFSKQYGAVFYMDLDRFKSINDCLGHALGDELLSKVAVRLKENFRAEDTVARLGGDEFVVIMTQLGKSEAKAVINVTHIADKVHKALNQPYRIGGHDISISPSIGISVFNDDAATADDVIKCADTAMYQAKVTGNAAYVYDDSMQKIADDRLLLENGIDAALAEQQLYLEIQPQADSDGNILAAECLIRWNKPEKDIVSPADFIPIAEETGKIIQIGDWIIEQAIKELEYWNEHGINLDYMAVNVSPKQFYHPDFVPKVTALLRSRNVNPKQLVMEITESIFISNLNDTIKKIIQLKELGIRFAIDDFGTGYSSLSYLHQLPVDILKVDQAFIRDVEKNDNNKKIYRSIILLAQNLGLDIVAEGVETKQELSFLQEHNCQKYQGFYFYKPVSIKNFHILMGRINSMLVR